MAVHVNKLHTFTGHKDCVYTLQRGIDEEIFFSGAGDGMIVKWDLSKPDEGELVAKLPNSVYALHVAGAGEIVVAGHNYDGIHLIDWQNKKEIGSLKLTSAPLFDIDGFDSSIYVATGDGELVEVGQEGLTILKRVKTTEKSARTISISELTGEIAVGYSDNTIRVFDLDGLTLKHEWKAHDNSVFTVRYTPDRKFLISGSRDARIKLWDAAAGYIEVTQVVAHMYAINHIEFSPDSKHFVTCSMDKSIKIWDLREMRLLKVIDKSRHAGHGTSVNKLLWSSFNNQLVSGSDDRSISVWDIQFDIKE
jgi:WD40 repeat protein